MGNGGSKPEQQVFSAYDALFISRNEPSWRREQRCASELQPIPPRLPTAEPWGM